MQVASSLHNADRLVEIVNVGRQPAAQLEQTIAAAHLDARARDCG